ncbi:MAG: hypothetical protein OEY34_04590 [Cyclobacteriaceae bacterium]|nr:hypothetical protein [Cyclobacteriaceae bacterium]
MDFNKIEQLLKKYWEGSSTLEEEQELKAFFSGNEVPEKWKGEQALFNYYQQASSQTKDIMSDDEIISMITSTEPEKKKVIRLTPFKHIFRVAAVILVIITTLYIVREEYRNNETVLEPLTDTFEDPKEAFEETKKALLLLSKNLGKGKTQVNKIKVFNEAENTVKNINDKKNEQKNKL